MHYIGEYYRYKNDKDKLKLIRFDTLSRKYHFECGHWCSEEVFLDLIRVKTGIQNYKMPVQLKLF